MAMEAQASKVVYSRRQSEREVKENTRQSLKNDASVLRETTLSTNVSDGSVEDQSSIQTLIEKMNKNLGVGVFFNL